jgi:hypothetical protein
MKAQLYKNSEIHCRPAIARPGAASSWPLLPGLLLSDIGLLLIAFAFGRKLAAVISHPVNGGDELRYIYGFDQMLDETGLAATTPVLIHPIDHRSKLDHSKS